MLVQEILEIFNWTVKTTWGFPVRWVENPWGQRHVPCIVSLNFKERTEAFSKESLRCRRAKIIRWGVRLLGKRSSCNHIAPRSLQSAPPCAVCMLTNSMLLYLAKTSEALKWPFLWKLCVTQPSYNAFYRKHTVPTRQWYANICNPS